MWARVDGNWFAHDKVIGLSLSARGLWISALSRTSKFESNVISPAFLETLTIVADGLSVDELVGELVDAGLWTLNDDGTYQFHDWDDHQYETLSQKRAKAGRKGGLKAQQRRRERERAERLTGSSSHGPRNDAGGDR